MTNAISVPWHGNAIIFQLESSVHGNPFSSSGRSSEVSEGIRFNAGERRRIRARVVSADDSDISVSDAKWKLLSNSGSVEDSGDISIDKVSGIEYVLSALIAPKNSNSYHQLLFDFSVGDERYLRKIDIQVGDNYGG
ncbi:MAG: hypothetical protein [Caudoviricetes sp.]|nr:MAG: hypothetical protein [Caudoviricetes sp.]